MKNPQFLELYLNLNLKQKAGFRRYLASPYFNTNKKLILSFYYLSHLTKLKN